MSPLTLRPAYGASPQYTFSEVKPFTADDIRAGHYLFPGMKSQSIPESASLASAGPCTGHTHEPDFEGKPGNNLTNITGHGNGGFIQRPETKWEVHWNCSECGAYAGNVQFHGSCYACGHIKCSLCVEEYREVK